MSAIDPFMAKHYKRQTRLPPSAAAALATLLRAIRTAAPLLVLCPETAMAPMLNHAASATRRRYASPLSFNRVAAAEKRILPRGRRVRQNAYYMKRYKPEHVECCQSSMPKPPRPRA